MGVVLGGSGANWGALAGLGFSSRCKALAGVGGRAGAMRVVPAGRVGVRGAGRLEGESRPATRKRTPTIAIG